MAMVYNIPKCLEYTLKSNIIRTDFDLQDHKWAYITLKLPYLTKNGHYDFLKSNPDFAESGAHDSESHLKSIKFFLQSKLDLRNLTFLFE